MTNQLSQFIPEELVRHSAVWATRLVASILIFVTFMLAGAILKKIVHGLAPRTDPQKQEVLALLGGIAKSALVIFGAITALGTLGVNVSALVAGLGLTGFALGFAFRDALSNVLAGVMILMYRPFHRGDKVSIVGLNLAGTVTGIDLRYTTLQNEQQTFLIPNSVLLTNAISLNKA